MGRLEGSALDTKIVWLVKRGVRRRISRPSRSLLANGMFYSKKRTQDRLWAKSWLKLGDQELKELVCDRNLEVLPEVFVFL